jgi:ATP-dependent exoDNAse (exonuclease V) beta subunit
MSICTTQAGLLDFDPKLHVYTLHYPTRSVVLPSVSQCLKRYFAPSYYTRPEVQKLAADGTALHLQIEEAIIQENAIRAHQLPEVTENHTKNEYASETAPQFAMYERFWATIKQQLPTAIFYPEIRLFDAARNLAGTIDCLVVLPDSSCIIIDWKRIKRLYTDGTVYAKPPFDDLVDCNTTQYTLQINLYASLLRNYTYLGQPCRVVKKLLVVFSPIETEYQIFEMATLDKAKILSIRG